MSVAEDVKDATRLWIDRLNNGTGLEGAWRLQRIDRRSRKIEGDESGIEERPARIRRFAKGIPANWVDEAVKYLISLAPYTDIVFNGTKLEGTYAPTRTWWERDEGATVDRGQMRENTYTLYQDLVDWKNADSTDFDAGGSCSETVHMRYEYDTFSIEDVSVPEPRQGLTVSVQAVSRNEDGTFNYAVVTRKAKTAIGTEQVIKCDEYQTVSQRVYQNLYGVEGAYTYDDSVTPVDGLPRPCDDRRTGLLIELTTRKNDDCTYDVTVTKTKAKKVSPAEHTKQKTLRGITEITVSRNVLDDSVDVHDIGERIQIERNPDGTYNRSFTHVVKEDVGEIGSSCQRTVFEHSHVETENVVTRPEEEAAQAGDGKTYQVQARITEEGTWDVTRTTTTELSRVKAQHTKQKTLRGVTETYVDRNVDDNDVTVTNIGDRVQIEMTPGGKYNRTVTRVIKEDVGEIGSSCQRTVFEHSHVTNENVVTRPEEEAAQAGDGKTYQVQARITEEGTWDVTRTTTTELKQKKAQHTKQKTLRGVTETYVDRNVDDNDVTVTNIGDRVQIEMTPGGKYNRTVTTVLPEPVGTVGESCSVTSSVHTDVMISNVPNGSQPDPQHQTPEVNVEKTVEIRRTEEGTWDVTSRETRHTAWGEKTIAVAENVSQKIEFHAFQNLEAAPSILAVTGEDIDASITRNQLGSFDGTFRKRIAKALDSGWITWTSEQEMPTYTYTWEHGLRVFVNQPVNWVSLLGISLHGKDGSVSASINSFGLVDGTASYRHLKSWATSGDVVDPGGIEKGVISVRDMDGTELNRFVIRAYSGGGNASAERHDKTHQVIIEGLQLPSRTYILDETPAPPSGSDSSSSDTSEGGK